MSPNLYPTRRYHKDKITKDSLYAYGDGPQLNSCCLLIIDGVVKSPISCVVVLWTDLRHTICMIDAPPKTPRLVSRTFYLAIFKFVMDFLRVRHYYISETVSKNLVCTVSRLNLIYKLII